MEKKAIAIILAAVALAAGLWAYAQFYSRLDNQAIKQSYIDTWGEEPPKFRGETVLEFYIAKPKENSIRGVAAKATAQDIINSLSSYRLERIPTAQTNWGVQVVTPESTYSLYIPENETQALAPELAQKLEAAYQASDDYVDIYMLLLPKQIDKISFSGTNKDANGTAVQLSLETADQETIAEVLDLLQKIKAKSFEYRPEGEKINIAGIDEGEGYTIFLQLGEVYEHGTITIRGSMYAFTTDISFQGNQRLYTCEYSQTKQMLNEIESLQQTVVD